jgi:pantoate--beta-alanine ligase
MAVCSLFVNPIQFNSPADLKKYPRNEAEDVRLAGSAGCDVVFAPSVETVYPGGLGGTRVVVPGVSERWEGRHRPGHFEGVATVVAKLFHLVIPDYAYFGEKDWQQCRVISKMVRDLDFPVHLEFGETVREADGLAMSSRNARLSGDARSRAAMMFVAIAEAAAELRMGTGARECEREAERAMIAAGFESVDYVAAVDGETLEPLDGYRRGARVLAAATIGGVRLIDNVGA